MLFPRSSRRRTRISALPLLFLTVLGLLIGGLGAPAYAATGTITGKVTRQGSLANDPLEDVVVSLRTSTGAAIADGPTATTLADGTYSLTTPDGGGTYTVFFSGDGLGFESEFYDNAADPASADDIVVSDGGTVSGIDGSLASLTHSEIGGRLTSTGGAPIGGAEFRLYERSPADAQTGEVTFTPDLGEGEKFVTDADGRWGPLHLKFGSYLLEVRAPAFGTFYLSSNGTRSSDPKTAPLITVVKGQAQTINASLPPATTTTISGQVRTDGTPSTPIRDVMISVEYPTTNSDGRTIWTEVQSTQARTDVNGDFVARVPVPEGERRYVVGFSAPGFVTEYFNSRSTRAAAVAGGDTVAPTFAAPTVLPTVNLAPATQVAGTVTDRSGAPLAGVVVRPVIYTPDPADASELGTWGPLGSTTATTGTDGTYVLDVPPATPFRLQFMGNAGREVRYFPNATDPNAAQNLTVAQNQVLTGRNAVLPTLSTLGGSIVNSDGTAYTGGGDIELWKRVDYTEQGEDGGPSHSTWELADDGREGDLTDELSATGVFSLTLPSGSYRLKLVDGHGGETAGFLPGLVGLDQAPNLTVGEQQTLSMQKYALPAPAEIRGTVRNRTSAPQTGKTVEAYYRFVEDVEDGAPVLSDWISTSADTTEVDGSYVLEVLSRTYRVGVANDGYYTTGTRAVSTLGDASDVAVSGVDVDRIDFRLTNGEPVNLQPPFITGVASEGETLTGNPGSWSGAALTFRYQWFQSDTVGSGYTPIQGATARTYAIPSRNPVEVLFGMPAFDDKSYLLQVTAVTGGTPAIESEAENSLPTGLSVGDSPIGAGDTATENRQRPQVSGMAVVGETLTGTDGVWSEGGTFTYQWLADGQPVAGATSRTLVITPALLNAQLQLEVTETTSDPDRKATSEPTARVVKGVLRNTARPTIAGDAVVGSTLTASPGTWNDPSPTFAYQWSANGQPISGATSSTLTLTEAQLGQPIAVTLTASKPSGFTPGAATSESTDPVGDDPTKVVSKTKPIVSGTAKVGETLSATDGTWSNEPTGFAYQWLADGTAVTGATSSTFVLTKDQRGKRMSVRVTASKTGLTSGTATSEETAAVAGGPLENKTKPTIAGQTLEGATLTADPGTWEPETATPVFTYQWVADGANIAGATARTYTLTSAEVGKTVTVKVTASANGYDSATETSAGVGPIDEPQGEIIVTGGPSIAGTDTVGELLSLNPGSVTPGDATITVQWFRDGTAITGATARTYRLVAADEDALITARVTYAKDDFVTLVKSTSAVGPVEPKAGEPDPVKPTLKTSKKVKGKKLVVKVRVLADSQDPVTGQVELTEGKKLYALKTLNNGKKKLVVKGLKKGFHSVKLTYLGNDLVKKRAKTLSFSIG